MKNKFFIIGMVFLLCCNLVFIGCSDPSGSSVDIDEKVPSMYSVSIPTADEEAEQLVITMKGYKWYVDNGYINYNNDVPNVPIINELKQKVLSGKSLTSTEEDQIRKLVKEELYKEDNYQAGLSVFRGYLRRADKEIQKLVKYQTAWGFFIPKAYTIRITLYAPSGGYNSSTGELHFRIFDRAYTNNQREWCLFAILHDSIHIGIEANIIQKYNLPHWTKERIVDHFYLRVFKGVAPSMDYFQSMGDTSIDVIFEQPDVLDHLPQRVEEFMKSK